MPLYKLIYSFIFFLLLTCSQRKPISLSSSSDFSKSKHPIARGGFTLPLITETLLWNTICFQKSREVKDKKQMAITQSLWRAWRLVFSRIWIRARKYTGQNVAKDNALTLGKLKFVLLSLRILSCNIIVCNTCIYGCFLRKIDPICNSPLGQMFGKDMLQYSQFALLTLIPLFRD